MATFGKIIGVLLLIAMTAYICFSVYKLVRDVLDNRKSRRKQSNDKNVSTCDTDLNNKGGEKN